MLLRLFLLCLLNLFQTFNLFLGKSFIRLALSEESKWRSKFNFQNYCTQVQCKKIISCKDRGAYWACTCVKFQLELTRVGVRVAVSFGPLIRGGLLVEVILGLHQRERLCEEGATAYRLVLSETAVTAALLRAIRQVKRDAPLRLEPRAQNRASDVSAPLCLCTPATLTTLCFTHRAQ